MALKCSLVALYTKMSVDWYFFNRIYVQFSMLLVFLFIGKAAAKSTEVDLFGPNLMDDFIDASAAIPATDSAVEPQVDLFADADFQSATTSTETTANMDVQVRFSIC
jgi:hypothetical protein